MVEKSFSNESMSEWLVFGHFNHLRNYLLTTQVLWDKMNQLYNKEVETSPNFNNFSLLNYGMDEKKFQ
jgi:hypothetical protein